MIRPGNLSLKRISRFGLALSLLLSLCGLSDAHASTCAPSSSTNGSYTFVSFTTVTTCNFQMPSGVNSIDLLVVGGGGSGGYDGGGGGGAGGVIIKSNYSVTSGNTYSITVGSGGAAVNVASRAGNSGNTSSFDVVSAAGGGGGGDSGVSGASGASGGGGGNSSGGAGSGTYASDGDATTYGNNGGAGYSTATYGGGGGGANGAGSAGTSSQAGAGGSGIQWTDNSTYYGGGGSGGSWTGTSSATANGGGGTGGHNNVAGTNGSANTGGGGGGGGGGGNPYSYAGSGGSGIVIIRYTTPTNPISISQQPASSNPSLGGTVTLTTVASASDGGTLSYQWYRQANLNDTLTALSDSGTAITGSQTNQLILTNVTASSTGLYSAEVTDTYNGAITFLWTNVAVVYISLANETFEGTTFSNPSNWVATYDAQAGGYTALAPCLTANSTYDETTTSTSPVTKSISLITGCRFSNVNGQSNSVVDSTTAGALRLVSAVQGMGAALIYNVAQATAEGLDISFYASQWTPSGSSQADGMTFFLKDGSDTTTASGYPSGGLGYSTHNTTVAGVPNGLFGIGLDAYGNYSNQDFGGSCPSGSSGASSTYNSVITRNGISTTEVETDYTSGTSSPNTPNGVLIRGPQGSDSMHGYCIISPTTSNGKAAVTASLGSTSFTSRALGVHYFRVLIDPSTAASPMMTLYIDGVQSISIATPKAYKDSPTFKFGFTGSTGASDENIDIYSTAVNTYTGVTTPDAPTAVTFTAGSAGAGTVSWSHDGQWGQGEASSGTRTFTATVYDTTGATSQGISCSTSASSGSPATSCSLSGLSSGTYVIKVNATNFSGLTSPDSLASISFTISNQGLTWTIKTATNSVYSNYNGSCTSNCAYSQQVYSDNTGNWVVLKFTNTSVLSDTSTVSLVDAVGTFTVPAKVTSFTYLIVGGGGGGGYDAGGGGGGGGIETGTVSGLSKGDAFTITVGSGGLAGGACNNPLKYNYHSTNGNCSSGVPSGNAYYSDACTYTDTSGNSNTDAHQGQDGMNGDSSTVTGAHSTNLAAYGGGGGGGRCLPGNSTVNIANSGGAGEKWFASNGFNSSNRKASTSGNNTPAGTQTGATYNIGGGASFFTGGGGGGFGSKGGTFGVDSYCVTNNVVASCTSGSTGSSSVYSILSSEGGAGISLFANSPMSGVYGGGGGGGTYCSSSSTYTDAHCPTKYSDSAIFPDGLPCISSCSTNSTSEPSAFATAANFGLGQLYALGGGSGGSGGVGDGASTTTPTANSGGGGGGGGGYSNSALVGAHGANGVVFIKYQLPITTSGTTISVNRNAAAGGSLTSGGTVLLEYAALTDTTPSCSTAYTVYSNIVVTNAVDYTFTVVDGDSSTIDNTHLARGYCYRWTQDPTLGTSEAAYGASPPIDSNGVAFGNLTSPVIMIPKRVGLKYPKVILVDPRASTASLPGMTKSLSGAGEPQFCFYEVSTNSTSATPMSTTITFTGSQITGQHLTNLPNGIQFYDVLAQAEKDLSSLKLTSSSTRYFHATRYVLIKTVPYMPTFNSDCTGANTGDLNTTSNDAYVITIKPLTLTRTVSKDIPVHH